MGALRQWCSVNEHRVLYDPREPNIDREIDKSWLRGVCRNSRFLLRFSVSSLVIDCHHEQSHVNWNVSHTYCAIFSLIPRVINCPTLYSEVWLISDLSLLNALTKCIPECIPTDTWLLTWHFHIRNDSKWGRSTENPHRRSKYVNRRSKWMSLTDSSTDRQFDWNSSQSIYDITMYRFK